VNCERCKKAHATLHLVIVENGANKEAHLCEPCGRKAGICSLNFTIEDLLGVPKKAQKLKVRERGRNVRCPGCKLTIDQIKETAKVGCARCYETFPEEFLDFARTYHKADQHQGKVPSTTSSTVLKEAELQRLKSYLDVVVKKEDYEQAAEIRDRIKRLEESLRGVEG